MTWQRGRGSGVMVRLAAVVLLGLFIRVGWQIAHRTATQLPDEREYLQAGENLRAGRGLCFFDPRFGQTVYAYRTPGYPALIALFGGGRGLRMAQAAIDASTIAATGILAMELGFDSVVALTAAGIVAVDPFLIYFSGLALSETLYVAMLSWGLALLAIGARRRTFRWMLAADIVLALSLLVRPSAFLLPLILRGVAAIVGRQTARQWVIGLSSATICCGIVLGCWGYRNRQVLGTFVFTSTNSGITLYDGFNPDARGDSDQRFVQSMLPTLRSMNEVQRNRYFSNAAWRFIVGNPWRCVTLTLIKIARTWSPLPLSEMYQTPVYVASGVLSSLPLDVLAIVGVFASRLPHFAPSHGAPGEGRGEGLPASDGDRAKTPTLALPRSTRGGDIKGAASGAANRSSWSAKLFLLAPAAYFTVVHGLSVGSLRYRLPAEPSMAVLAALGLWVALSCFPLAPGSAGEKHPAESEANG